jgi:hypothetical protein
VTRPPPAAALVLVALVLAGGTACTSERPSKRAQESGKTGGASVTGPVPRTPGTVLLGVPEEPASLNPFDPRSRTQAGLAVLGAMLPQLFRVDPDGRAQGFLVEEASVQERPGAVSFSLRPGVRWSDGKPITADDVRFTLEVIRSEAWPGPRSGYDRVAGVVGSGAEVVVRFDGSLPGWRRLFSGEDFLLPAHRLRGKNLGREWARGPDVAGGPFILGAVTPGLEVVLERNPQWWGKPLKVEVLRVQVVPDDRTMEQLLQAKELDVAWPPAVTHRITRLRALEGVEVSVARPGGALVSLVANTERLTGERRAALLGLPDRDRFVTVLLGGEAALGTSVVPGAAGGPWATVGPDRNRPGLGGGTLVMAAEVEEPMSPLLGRVLEGQARARGVTVELKFAEATKVEGAWLREGRFDVATVDQMDWPQPCWLCRYGSAAVGRGNAARVKGLDDLAAAADAGDPAAPATLEARLRSEAVLLPLWRPSAVLASRGVKDVVANSWSIGPFWGAENWAPAG